MDDKQHLEIWLRLYEGQNDHVRHHEVLRTQSTNLVVLGSVDIHLAAILAAIIVATRYRFSAKLVSVLS